MLRLTILNWIRGLYNEGILLKLWRYMFFVSTTTLLLFTWINFLGVSYIPYIEPISYIFLFITLYQLDVHSKVDFLWKPKIPLFVQRRIPQIIVASLGSFAYFCLNFSLTIFEQFTDESLFVNGAIAIILLVFLFLFSQAVRIWFFPMLKFKSKISENQYTDVINGVLFICIFLGAGGDLFADSAILTVAFARLRALTESERFEKKFWTSIWRRQESTINELVSGNAFFYGIVAIGLNLRFITPKNPLQWVFIAFCLVPMVAAYATRPHGRMSLIIITTQVLSMVCSWAIVLAFPSALPFGSFAYSIVEYMFTNPQPWVKIASAYFWVSLSAGILVLIAISSAKLAIRSNIAGKRLILDLVGNLTTLAMISSIVEILLTEKLIANLIIQQQVQAGQYQGTFLILNVLNVQGIAAGIMVLFCFLMTIMEALSLFGFHQLALRKHWTMNKKRTLALCLSVTVLFSVGMVTSDVLIMTSNKSTYYSKGRITFSTNFTAASVQVIGVTDWISLNLTYPENCTLWAHVLFHSFGMPHQTKNITGGQSMVLFEPLFSGDYYLEFGVYDVDNKTNADVSFVIERGRPPLLSGGPLLLFPLYCFFLILPMLHMIVSTPTRVRR